ncbi:hypothetical protein GCM10022237_28740 [Nocardioides ginsengisoli]|uniref:Uncharacterized protein n=1 Tax=Nocardioides ginsengisoli TaxID=363868 RepID=A0ABW3W2Q1_9ACTN
MSNDSGPGQGGDGVDQEPPAITWDQVREEVAAFEARHPGLGADNYRDAFTDAAGAVVHSAELEWIESLYTALEVAPSGEPHPGHGFLIG